MNDTLRNALVSLALKLQGTPYRWGGSNPRTGFDCSGFVIWILQVFGALPSGDWTAHSLKERFEFTTLDPVTGDLVYYGGDLTKVTHVGIYIGGGDAILCSGGDSTTTTTERAIEQNAFVKIKPVRYRRDFLGYGKYELPGETI